MAEDGAEPCLLALPAEALPGLGSGFGGFHARGLCVKSCTASAPIPTAFHQSCTPPEQCAPISISPGTLRGATPRPRPRGGHHGRGANGSSLTLPFSSRRLPPRRRRRRGTSARRRRSSRSRSAVLLQQQARPVGEREENVVPLRSGIGAGVLVGDRRARQVEKLAAALVSEAAERLERVQRVGEVSRRAGRPVGEAGAPQDRTPRGSGGRARRGRPSFRPDAGTAAGMKKRRGRAEKSAACVRSTWAALRPNSTTCAAASARPRCRAPSPCARAPAGTSGLSSNIARNAPREPRAERQRLVVRPGAHVGERGEEHPVVARREREERAAHLRRLHDPARADRALERLAPERGKRVQRPTYGACGYCARMPARRSIALSAESLRRRAGTAWRAWRGSAPGP